LGPPFGAKRFLLFYSLPFQVSSFFLFFTSLLLLFSHQKFKSDFYSLHIQKVLSHSQHHALTSDGKGERDDTTFSFPFLSLLLLLSPSGKSAHWTSHGLFISSTSPRSPPYTPLVPRTLFRDPNLLCCLFIFYLLDRQRLRRVFHMSEKIANSLCSPTPYLSFRCFLLLFIVVLSYYYGGSR
jgi:hypothetical protein